MIPWTLLDTSPIPGDSGEMRLYQRGSEFSIRVGSYELMNSRVHGSEDALASLVCERIAEPKRILVGGLGMGYTLAAVLQHCGAAEVVIAELVPAVVAWHRGPLAAVSNGTLNDPRVVIREQDVAQVIRDDRGFDAILLDVDNGPAGLTSKHNDRLYDAHGLRAAQTALRPGGILAVWSAGPDERFTKRLKQAGFDVEEVRVRGRGAKGGARYLIWLARRAA
ncbi:MAG TPA: spermidine synthase [Thermoanaerobaculia bacterium]|nr:spermidine synthase [Thermoanaerobaculia bacterium]